MSARSLLTIYLTLKGFLCLFAGLIAWLVVEDSSWQSVGFLSVSLIEFLLAAALSCHVKLGV